MLMASLRTIQLLRLLELH